MSLEQAEREVLKTAAFITSSGYFHGQALNNLAAELPADCGMNLTEYVSDITRKRYTASQITKYRGWAKLPDIPEAHVLGVTRGYKVSRLSPEEIMKALGCVGKIGPHYLWEDFDAEVFGQVPEEERDICPTCLRRMGKGKKAPQAEPSHDAPGS